MSVSRRHAIHWPDSQPPDGESEPTSTVVVSSPAGIFVDVRCTKLLHPEWFFAGDEVTDPDNDSVVEFNHAFFDSQYVSDPKAAIPPDIGTFTDPDDPGERAAGIRVETGAMVNPATGVMERYVEKWITADPYSRDLHWVGGDAPDGVRCVVLQTGAADKMCNVLQNECTGRLVCFGNWTQGVFWCNGGDNKEDTYGVVRMYKDEVIVEHGAYAKVFPSWESICGVTREGEILTVGESVEWKVVEYVS